MKKLVRMLTENSEETTPDHEDPGLRTRILDVSDHVDAVSVAAKAFRLLSRSSVKDMDVDNGRITAERKTFSRTFTDDMIVKLTKDDINRRYMVNVFSSSRVGKGDLGQNARNIRSYFKALEKLTGVWKDAEVIK